MRQLYNYQWKFQTRKRGKENIAVIEQKQNGMDFFPTRFIQIKGTKGSKGPSSTNLLLRLHIITTIQTELMV